jgi:hypothetical protein
MVEGARRTREWFALYCETPTAEGERPSSAVPKPARSSKAAVLSKARRYGELGGRYVIAVAPTSPIVHIDDVVAALVGTRQRHFDPNHPDRGELVLLRDGAWSTGAEGVAGILIGADPSVDRGKRSTNALDQSERVGAARRTLATCRASSSATPVRLKCTRLRFRSPSCFNWMPSGQGISGPTSGFL